MNQRIRELLLEAKSHTQEGKWHSPTSVWTEKFAELIVEECRNVLADEYRKTPLECCGHFLRADEVLAGHFYGVKV